MPTLGEHEAAAEWRATSCSSLGVSTRWCFVLRVVQDSSMAGYHVVFAQVGWKATNLPPLQETLLFGASEQAEPRSGTKLVDSRVTASTKTGLARLPERDCVARRSRSVQQHHVDAWQALARHPRRRVESGHACAPLLLQPDVKVLVPSFVGGEPSNEPTAERRRSRPQLRGARPVQPRAPSSILSRCLGIVVKPR